MTITVARSVSSSALREEMTETVSTVSYRGERVGITRHGKLVAVMVPVADVELLERFEEAEDVRAYDAAKAADTGERLSADDVFAHLG